MGTEPKQVPIGKSVPRMGSVSQPRLTRKHFDKINNYKIAYSDDEAMSCKVITKASVDKDDLTAFVINTQEKRNFTKPNQVYWKEKRVMPDKYVNGEIQKIIYQESKE